jgi:hypothetical protein
VALIMKRSQVRNLAIPLVYTTANWQVKRVLVHPVVYLCIEVNIVLPSIVLVLKSEGN